MSPTLRPSAIENDVAEQHVGPKPSLDFVHHDRVSGWPYFFLFAKNTENLVVPNKILAICTRFNTTIRCFRSRNILSIFLYHIILIYVW